MDFSADELKRYNRHIILNEIGIEGQAKLKQAKVLVVGAGGLGCPVLQYLAAAGVGTIGIIDHDVVNASNLQRQILYSSEDIGFSKVEKAVEKLSKINPFVTFRSFPFQLTKENALRIIREFDLVIDGTDNFSTRYLVNDACVILKKPLLFGSIFKFEGQVTVFNYKSGPTYRCLFPEPTSEGEVPNCSQIGVLGVLPGIIGTLQANEAIKIITGIGEVLSGRLFVIDLLTFQSQQYKFSKVEGNSLIDELGNYEETCEIKDSGEVTEWSVYDLKEAMDRNEALEILDVRPEYEVDICNIGGTHIPFENIPASIDRIDKDKKVVVLCHHGIRSREAVKYLQEKHGFRNLVSLEGGIHQWAMFIDEEMETY